MGLASFAHRHVWQRLPREVRRGALMQVSSALAPRPSPAARPSWPVAVLGALSTASGLGQSARLCLDALRASGLDAGHRDLSLALFQPADHAFGAPGRRGDREARTLVVHVNSPLMALAAWRIGRATMRDAYVIGYWAWELPRTPPDWRYGVPFVNEIWVPSRFVADAIEPIAGGRPVRVVPHAVAMDARPSVRPRADEPRPFTVLTIFNVASSLARKNPVAAIAAFRRAFGDDAGARLIVKASHGQSYPEATAVLRQAMAGAANVVLIEDVLGADEIDALYAESDAVVSLHRSEGFGLTLAEAMVRGVPVVATDWSGNTDFVTAETGMPIPFELIPARDPQETYEHPDMLWAEADIDAAADALRRLRSDRALARRLGDAAAAFARANWSADRYAERVLRYLGS